MHFLNRKNVFLTWGRIIKPYPQVYSGLSMKCLLKHVCNCFYHDFFKKKTEVTEVVFFVVACLQPVPLATMVTCHSWTVQAFGPVFTLCVVKGYFLCVYVSRVSSYTCSWNLEKSFNFAKLAPGPEISLNFSEFSLKSLNFSALPLKC